MVLLCTLEQVALHRYSVQTTEECGRGLVAPYTDANPGGGKKKFTNLPLGCAKKVVRKWSPGVPYRKKRKQFKMSR